MKCFVYRNLHKNLFSVKALEGPYKGRVVLYTDCLLMKNVTFKVSQKGRQRVIDSGVKNVHAGIEGIVEGIRPGLDKHPHDFPTFKITFDSDYRGKLITYNPFKYNSFVSIDTKQPVKTAQQVYLIGTTVMAAGLDQTVADTEA